MQTSVVQEYLGNADLVIGTPEYNKVRYPGSTFVGSPIWLCKLKRQIAAKNELKGKKSYFRRADGYVFPRRYQEIDDDIYGCFAESLHLKTKSYEYIPKTGKIYLYGQEAASLNRQSGIFSFTLRNIDTGKSRFFLRKLGIRLTSEKGKTYWKIEFGSNFLQKIIAEHGGLEVFRFHYRHAFPTMTVINHPVEPGKSILKLGLRKDLYYQCGCNNENMNRWFGGQIDDAYSETDIFGVYVPEKPLVDVKQYQLEFEERKGSYVKPGISLGPSISLII